MIFNNFLKKYFDHYKNDWFLYWFEQVYGGRQTRILKNLAAKKNKLPYDCVGLKTQAKYDRSEHNGDDWLPVKPNYSNDWRN